MQFTIEELGELLSTLDLTGFTHCIRGPMDRYVVGLTNNKEWSLDLLLAQISYYATLFDSVTIGGRTDPQSNEVYIDVGTTLDDKEQALQLGSLYHQQCIRDTLLQKEIRI